MTTALPSASVWQPANVVEQLMAQALDRGEHRTLLDLLASASLYVPGQPDSDGRMELVAEEADGQTCLPVFTSPAAFAGYRPTAPGFFVMTWAELAEIWPDPAWRLVVNPHSPITVDISGTTLTAAGHPDPALGQAGRSAGFAGTPVERLLHEAITTANPDLLVRALIAAWVLVPVAQPVALEVGPGDPQFPWQPLVVGKRTAIVMFTSAARIVEVAGHQPGPVVTARLVDVLRAWPDPSSGFVVNPGSPVQVMVADEDRDTLIGVARSIVTLTDPPRPDISLDALDAVVA
jgi:hypothetical protein